MRFGFEQELAHVGHTLWIEDAVQVIVLVLHDTRVKALGYALDQIAVRVIAPIADMPGPFDEATQARNRETPFPAAIRRRVEVTELRVALA